MLMLVFPLTITSLRKRVAAQPTGIADRLAGPRGERVDNAQNFAQLPSSGPIGSGVMMVTPAGTCSVTRRSGAGGPGGLCLDLHRLVRHESIAEVLRHRRRSDAT